MCGSGSYALVMLQIAPMMHIHYNSTRQPLWSFQRAKTETHDIMGALTSGCTGHEQTVQGMVKSKVE